MKKVTVARAKESSEIVELLQEMASKGLTEEIMESFFAIFAGIAYHQANLRLPDALALGIEVDDWHQKSVLELLEGVHRFEESRGAYMAAYLKTRVVGMLQTELRDEFREQIKVTKSDAKAATAATEETEVSEDITYMLKVFDVESELRTADCDENFNPWDAIAINTHTPEHDAILEENKKRLAVAMTTLTALEREVIQMHCLKEEPLREVASKLGISIPRAHQLKQSALARMRQFMTEGSVKQVQKSLSKAEREGVKAEQEWLNDPYFSWEGYTPALGIPHQGDLSDDEYAFLYGDEPAAANGEFAMAA